MLNVYLFLLLLKHQNQQQVHQLCPCQMFLSSTPAYSYMICMKCYFEPYTIYRYRKQMALRLLNLLHAKYLEKTLAKMTVSVTNI